MLDAEPGTEAAFDQVRALRSASTQADPGALVGGADAEALDARDATARDRLVLFPLILVIVLGCCWRCSARWSRRSSWC